MKFGSILKMDGEPVVVQVETLSEGWDHHHHTVYILPEHVVETLEELVRSHGQAPAREAADDDDDDDDDESGGCDDDPEEQEAVDDERSLRNALRTSRKQALHVAVREGP